MRVVNRRAMLVICVMNMVQVVDVCQNLRYNRSVDLKKMRQAPQQSSSWGLGRLCRTVYAVLSSNRFFYGVIVVLVLQASWLALTGRYPMAYDEQNHIGIVKLYSAHISPFWDAQPPGDAPFSAVSRDPSYMYHYVMSFAYRLFDLFWKTDEAKIIAFRFISIALFAGGLVLYRKLLLRTRASKALVHTILGLFVLIPTVPFLAAQMNYDNLLFPLLAGMLLLTTQIVADIHDKAISARRLGLFAGVGMLTGLVKFPALPLLLAMAIWIVVAFCRRYGKKDWRQGLRQIIESFQKLRRLTQVGLVLLVLVSGVLFVERYGVNTVRYGTPVPACDKVLDEQRCMAFGPWKRNYDINIAKQNGTLTPVPPSTGPVYFTIDEWGKLLYWQFFYALDGPTNGFVVGFPYPTPYFVAAVLLAIGTLAVLLYWRRVFDRPYIKGLTFVALFYIAILWLQNYSDFRQLHLATAIQARYIVPTLPILLLLLALGFRALLQKITLAKSPLAVLTLLVLLTQGAGISVYILRSNPSWWWPNASVVHANETAQKILSPLVINRNLVDAPKQNY